MTTRRVRAARRTWARLTSTLRRAVTADVITVNDDFTDHLTDVPALIRWRRPFGIAVQEGKNTRYRPLVKGMGYGVRQNTTTSATAGVSVLWDRKQAHAVRRPHRDRPRRRGHGYAVLVGPAHGIQARGVVWQDLRVRRVGWRKLTPGRRPIVRLASTHRPPKRADASWPAYDAALTRWLAASPHPVILGTDNNDEDRPDVPARWEWHHVGIDGVLTDVTVLRVTPLAQSVSDHRAVSAEVVLPER